MNAAVPVPLRGSPQLSTSLLERICGEEKDGYQLHNIAFDPIIKIKSIQFSHVFFVSFGRQSSSGNF